ncbi:N-acetylmuramoyl-L-alanine amidase [Cryptosporangium phraense]|uniref:N-acetylmuramoyl-L-alanine amidase n=1 Tax=Cryptosporangium phraense TaxID=2593070 RepID=UPI00147813EB|nr:N-acetylmuramoyl-L-alanine amidase [Cryptosporangium phraense]
MRVKKKNHWSKWTTTEFHGRAKRAGRAGPGLIWTGDATAVETVLTSPNNRLPTDVTADLINPGTTTALFPKMARQPASLGNGVVRIFGRAAWGASPAYLRTTPRYAPRVRAVVVHHTATTNNYDADDVPRILRSIYYYMSVTERYGDIGYNALIDKYGRIWEGRAGGLDRPTIGMHAGGFNTGTAGVALIGDYDHTPVSAAAREALARFAAYKLGTSGTDPRATQTLDVGPSTRYRQRTAVRVPAIVPHQATSTTACPGERLDVLPAVRARADALVDQYHLGGA